MTATDGLGADRQSVAASGTPTDTVDRSIDLSEGLRLEQRGDLPAAAAYYRRLLVEVIDDRARVQLLLRLSHCNLETELDQAEEDLTQARRAAEPLDDEVLLAEVEILEGRLALERRHHRQALKKFSAAAERLSAAGDERLDVTIRLAQAERLRGELNSALSRLEAIDTDRIERDLDLKAEFLDELGALHIARGDFAQAVEVLTEAHALDEARSPHEYSSASSALLLAEAHLGRGERAIARKRIQDAIENFERAASGLSQAYALMGWWHEDSGDFASATRYYKLGFEVDVECDDDIGQARALRSLARVARKRGDKQRAREHLDAARGLLTGTDDDVERAAMLTEEAELAIDELEYGQAMKKFRQALAIHEEDQDEHAIALAKRNLANAVWEQGDLDEAERLLREAQPVLEERGNLLALNDLLDDLGEVLIERDEYRGAIDVLLESQRLDEQLGTVASRARTLQLLGRAHLQIGERKRAGDFLREAREVCEEADDDVGRSNVLIDLAGWYADEGKLRDAVRLYRGALALDTKHDDSLGLARAHRGLAGVYRRLGDLDRAAEHIEDAEAQLAGTDDRVEPALLAIEQGRLALAMGKYVEAEQQLRTAMRRFQQTNSPVQEATCQRLLAQVFTEQAAYRKAIELLESAQAVFERCHDYPELDELYDDFGEIYLRQGNLRAARDAVNRSLELGREMGWHHGRGRSLVLLGAIAMQDGDAGEARRHLEEAIKSYETAEDEVGRADSFLALGDLHAANNDFKEAITSYKEARRIDLIHRDLRGLARTCRKLGDVYFLRGEFARAEEYYEQADEQLRGVDDARQRGPLMLSRGTLFAAQGDHLGAVNLFNKALECFEELSDGDQRALTYRRLAASYQALERFDDSMRCMREMGLEHAAIWQSLLSHLDPAISAVSTNMYASGNFWGAVFAAFRVLDEEFGKRVPGKGHRPIGHRVHDWATPEARGLPPFDDVGQLDGYAKFCTGAFGMIRNSLAHRNRGLDSVDAFAALCVAHLIARYMDADQSAPTAT